MTSHCMHHFNARRSAFAVSKGASGLGAGEASLIVRRRVSLTASLPRIVRVGDKFKVRSPFPFLSRHTRTHILSHQMLRCQQ
jgi:hypothetical protein